MKTAMAANYSPNRLADRHKSNSRARVGLGDNISLHIIASSEHAQRAMSRHTMIQFSDDSEYRIATWQTRNMLAKP